MKIKFVLFLLLAFLAGCSNTAGHNGNAETSNGENAPVRPAVFEDTAEPAAGIIDKDGKTVEERFGVPDGFARIPVDDGSFEQYLREFPLKPHGAEVMYYNGEVKERKVHEAVLDIDTGSRDLQQCADAVIRLRAEYLYSKGYYDRIHFNFTNAFNAEYKKWMQGNRIAVDGNNAYWVKREEYSEDYAVFRKYLDTVFAYAGTLSLSKEMRAVPVDDMGIGDVFIKGGSPGHCVIIMDMAEDSETGEKIFVLAQGYMPAQDMHILKNPDESEISPWYSVKFGDTLVTPEWSFKRDQLMRFDN